MISTLIGEVGLNKISELHYISHWKMNCRPIAPVGAPLIELNNLGRPMNCMATVCRPDKRHLFITYIRSVVALRETSAPMTVIFS